MAVGGVELQGKHVRVLPMAAEHVDELFAAGHHAQIWAYMSMRVQTRQDMQRLVQQALERREGGREFPFVVQDVASGRLVGSTRFLDISEADRHLEIGWTWYTPDVWRTVINTETKYLLLRHCFEDLSMMRVQLKTDGRNTRSQTAIARIGGVREGVLRKHMVMPDGFVRDSVYFSILDDEWADVRRRLEAMLDR